MGCAHRLFHLDHSTFHSTTLRILRSICLSRITGLVARHERFLLRYTMVLVPIQSSLSDGQFSASADMHSCLFEGEDILPGRKDRKPSAVRSPRKIAISHSTLEDPPPPSPLDLYIYPASANVPQTTKPKKAIAPTKVLPLTYEVETLPYDLIVKTLYCFSSFKDLYGLLTASPICFRLFDSFSKSVSIRVAKNTIGKDAWEETTAILIYQRDDARMSMNPNGFGILKEEL